MIYTYNCYLPNDTKKITADYSSAVIHFKPEYPASITQPLIDKISTPIEFHSIELRPDIYEFIKANDKPEYTYYIPGIINESTKSTLINNNYWIKTTASYYNNFTTIDTHEKPYYFEVMYGTIKQHRLFICANINKFRDKVFETPFLQMQSVNNEVVQKNEYWENDIIIDNNMVIYNNHRMLPSQVLPKKIYDKAAFSIIPETFAINEFSFFTEKIVKPIIAGRLFIVISGQYYLKNLRKLGFKTFNGIIDESYDEISDNKERWLAALNEAQKLTKIPQTKIINDCYDILKHNYEQIFAISRNN